MPSMRVFQAAAVGPIRTALYCLDYSLHVHVVDDGGIAIGTRRDVTPCDGSCEDRPVLKELEASHEAVEEARRLLNR
jgi:hypothetical protein